MPKRFDSDDFGDAALHTLHRLRAEGLIVKDFKCAQETETIPGSTVKLPTTVLMTIRLEPGRTK